MSDATVVLVHGAAAGSWTWHLVTDGLRERDVAVVTVDLPSCSAPDASVDLHDDADHVRGVLDATAGPKVVVANSYGGAVMSEAAVDRTDVMRLVYISALMPKPNETMAEVIGSVKTGLADGLHMLDDGRMFFDPDVDMAASFQNASQEEQDYIRPHLGKPMSFGFDSQVSLPKVAWRTIPSTYVVCTEDLALPAESQREWAKERATDVIEWPADHSPQHSRPDLVIDLLEKLARS